MNCKHCKEKDEEIKKLHAMHSSKTDNLNVLLKELKETLRNTIKKQTELLKNVSGKPNHTKLIEVLINSLGYFTDIFVDLCELLHKKLGDDSEVVALVDKLSLQMYEISELTTEASRMQHETKNS